MNERFDSSVFYKKHIAIQYIASILICTVLLAGALAALLVNTVNMNRQLQENAEYYADDVSAQLASNISSRMSTRETYMRNLADTFSKMPKFVLTEELLDRKAEYLEMEAIFLLNMDGTTFPANAKGLHPELEDHLLVHSDIHKESHIFYSDHNEVFFSAPIFWEDGTETSTLVGVRSNATIQQMLQEVDFKDQGLCCIADSSGSVVVSATDMAPFMALKEVFDKNTTKENIEEVMRVQADIKERRAGVAQFGNVGDESIMMGYDFLGINDWILLTLIPADLFSEGTTPYLVRYIVIIVFMVLVMFGIIFLFSWSSRNSLKQLQVTALTDPLTGERNYLAFRMEGEHLLQEHPERSYAIIYLNIRNFKRFNERFGVKRGDELLQQVSQTLRSSLKEGELLSRNDGDHFYLLLACADENEVLWRVNKMLEERESQFFEEFTFGPSSFHLGAYLIREMDTVIMLLADRAKVASSYQQGNDICRFYDEELSKQLKREQSLDNSFRRAIENHEFQLYIQPKVSADQAYKSEGEVLVRWQHPEFGMVFPGEFIPLLEKNGKICDLDFYMFEETCKLQKAWLAQGREVRLSVNLSRAHLVSSDMSFLDWFKNTKEAYQIPDGLIELELTESLMLERRDFRLVTAIIDRLRSMGFHCSIDDFGFGYSSLALLKNLNVNTIKLDRQFFLDESEKSWIVVRQLIQLAHDLNMTVVAEGIEEDSQVEKLRQYDCDLIQGYVYAKPMAAAEFKNWSVSKKISLYEPFGSGDGTMCVSYNEKEDLT